MTRLHLPLALVGALLLAGPAAADDTKPDTHVPTASVELTEVYFNTGSAQLSPGAGPKLASIVEMLKTSGNDKVFLGGFADSRGTAPDNTALSIRRAEAVRDHLMVLGVPEDKIIIGIYGEEAPQRESLAQDRRVSVGLTGLPLHEIVDETLSEAIAVVWSEPVTAAELEGGRPIPVATRE